MNILKGRTVFSSLNSQRLMQCPEGDEQMLDQSVKSFLTKVWQTHLRRGSPLSGKAIEEVRFGGTQPLVFLHPITPHSFDSSKYCLKFYI